MQTTRLCAAGWFSTTTRLVAPMSMPSSRQAALPSANRRALKAGSLQARATTRAPIAGLRLSIFSIWRRTSSAVSTPFSIRSARTASPRRW